jgi:prolipoprotein diacylglyceryl transferase
VPAVLASIPSPHSSEIDLGPVSIHMYGLMLLAGILACIGLTGLRWTNPSKWSAWYRAHGGDPEPRDWDLIFRVAVWGVAAGIVGARLYHDITSWNEVPDPKWRGIFAVWQGGLGVWGGIALGTLVGAWVTRRAGHSVRELMDVVAPGLLVAQGIGRIGNWWNQELYGKPTDLPWKLEIDFDHQGGIDTAYQGASGYHPTFLYELIWNLGWAGILLLIGRRFRIRPPALFALYVAVYCFGRFFEELLRVDPAHEIAGLRLNAWISIIVFVASAGFFVWWQFFRRGPAAPGAAARKGPTMAVPRGRVRPSR